jgi:hypothetical protein
MFASERHPMRPLPSAKLILPLALAAALAGCQTKTPAPKPNGAELNSFSGRPRILVVHRNSPESRPLLVVQAEGNPAKLDAFGPLMSEPVGARIATDVRRWAAGGKGC